MYTLPLTSFVPQVFCTEATKRLLTLLESSGLLAGHRYWITPYFASYCFRGTSEPRPAKKYNISLSQTPNVTLDIAIEATAPLENIRAVLELLTEWKKESLSWPLSTADICIHEDVPWSMRRFTKSPLWNELTRPRRKGYSGTVWPPRRSLFNPKGTSVFHVHVDFSPLYWGSTVAKQGTRTVEQIDVDTFIQNENSFLQKYPRRVEKSMIEKYNKSEASLYGYYDKGECLAVFAILKGGRLISLIKKKGAKVDFSFLFNAARLEGAKWAFSLKLPVITSLFHKHGFTLFRQIRSGVYKPNSKEVTSAYGFPDWAFFLLDEYVPEFEAPVMVSSFTKGVYEVKSAINC